MSDTPLSETGPGNVTGEERVNEKKYRKWAVLLVAVFIIFLIPAVYLGRYDYPWSDDFEYSYRVYHTYRDTGSFFRAVGAAAEVVKTNYLHWQGTYSSIFLMSLLPGVLYESGFWMKPLIMLSVLSAGIFSLLYTVGRHVLKADRYITASFSAVCCFVMIQTIPHPRHGYFWYNGAVHYTFMCGLLLILVTLLLRTFVTHGHAVAQIIGACICAVVIGGGNHITAMLMVLLLPVMAVLFYLYDKRKEKAWKAVIGVWVLGTAAYIVNAMAPGNTYRQSRYNKPNLIYAVIASVQDAVDNFTVGPLMLVVLAVAVPLLWMAVRKNRIRVRLPWLCLAACLCFYIVMFFPTHYTGYSLQERMLNVIFIMRTFLLLFVELILVSMWENRAGKATAEQKDIPSPDGIRALAMRIIIAGWILIMLCFTASFRWYSSEQPMMSLSAIYSLATGEAAQFGREMKERFRILNETTETKVDLAPLTTETYLIPGEDLIVVPTYWVNVAWCHYFEKEEIKIVIPEETEDAEASEETGESEDTEDSE